MGYTEPAWLEFRDVVYGGDFARAGEMLRDKPEVLHMVNGIGETVLNFLAVEDARDGVAWLHAQGADINTKNAFGQPVVFEVAQLSYKELFTWFKERGANLRATDGDGNDLVSYLLEYDHPEMAEWVRTDGA
jgi:hypothetical protein